MDGGLTLEELSRWTGEPVERLCQWRSLGLIGVGDDGEIRFEDIERARLVRMFLRRGFGLESIARAAKGGLLDRYIEMLPQSGGGPAYSLAEAAELVGIDLEMLRRCWEASGLSEQGEMLGEEDVQTFQAIKVALEAGLPKEALLQLVRVYSDALGRAAEAEARLFHFYVHERLKADGLSGQELMDATQAAGDRMLPLTEPVVRYFHRRGQRRALREDAVMHLAEETGLLEEAEVPGQLQRAVAFIDLSSFTPLAEAMGDVKAAEVLERFSALVREIAGRWDGRVVKQVGDAFLLMFPDARSAVACSLEIEARAGEEPQFPAARGGIHWGPVLYREGDYVGSNVNIASRVAVEAERHQTLVTAMARKEARGLPDVEFVPLGKRRLKGLAEELELFEARRSGVESRGKTVDPVCGMELGPHEVVGRLVLDGVEHVFCSDDCLRLFVARPEQYSS